MSKLTILTGLTAEAGVIEDRSNVRVLCGLQDLQAMESLIPPACPGVIGFSVVGGLTPDRKVGDVVLATNVVTAGLRTYMPDGAWNMRIAGLIGTKLPGVPTRFFSDPAELADTPSKRSSLFAQTSATVVDMGSYAIAAWCARHSKPFVIIGAISDTFDQTVTGNPAIMNPDGSANVLEILKEARGNQALFSNLMHEAATFTRAIWALRAVYHLIVPSWGF